MITIAGGTPVWLATGVTDLRRGFNGLTTLVAQALGGMPTTGALYVFCNRRRDLVKMVFADTGGFWVCAKRLEEGTFRWPAAGARTVQLTAAELQLLLSGIDLTRTRLRRWWPGAQTAQPTAPPSAPAARPVGARVGMVSG